jgi:ABC-type Na+ transport system ATPase subunit NatA
MSDTESDHLSTTSFGDISVCKEISEFIERCEELHTLISNSANTLNQLKNIIDSNATIKVTYNGVTCNLDEILEQIHQETLESIPTSDKNVFGEKLLAMLNNANFS